MAVCLLAAYAFGQSFQNIPRGDALLGRTDVANVLAHSAEILDRAIPKFADVKDPALRQVRQAMERERAALGDLMEAISRREALLADLRDASAE